MIHEKAKENFNRKTEELLLFMHKYEVPKEERYGVNEDIYVSHKIKSEDIIGGIKFGLTNDDGDDVGKYFKYQDSYYGIYSDKYKILKEIASNIFRNKSIKSRVSYKFVKEELFEWAKQRFEGTSSADFCSYLEDRINEVVKTYEILIPIPYTSIISPIKIGCIEFKNIKKSFFNDRFEEMREQSDEKLRTVMLEFQNRIRRDFQGYMAGVCIVTAEADRAQELVYEEISLSLSILRTFSESNYIIGKHNLSHEYAYKTMRTKCNFMIDVESGNMMHNNAFLDGDVRWNINCDKFPFIEKQVNIINEILSSSNRTEFQEKVLDSLVIYSKNILLHDISDRILYILVALESLLLRNNSESIQQNIGERLAFAIGKDANDRKSIVNNVKEVYSHRSKFVHHGIEIDTDKKVLNDFMRYAWIFIQGLFNILKKYDTKAEYIDSFDSIKYG